MPCLYIRLHVGSRVFSSTAHRGIERKEKIVTSRGLNLRPTLYCGFSVAKPLISAATICPSSPYIPVTGWLPCCRRNPGPLRLCAKWWQGLAISSTRVQCCEMWFSSCCERWLRGVRSYSSQGKEKQGKISHQLGIEPETNALSQSFSPQATPPSSDHSLFLSLCTGHRLVHPCDYLTGRTTATFKYLSKKLQ